MLICVIETNMLI